MNQIDDTQERNQRIEKAKAMLMAEYGIESAFVRVPALAKVLGLAESTIYALMRSDRFFLPHRLLGTVPAVRLEDLVAWYCEESEGEPKAEAAIKKESPRAEKDQNRREESEIVAQVLESMGVAGSGRRRSAMRV